MFEGRGGWEGCVEGFEIEGWDEVEMVDWGVV